MFDFNQDYILEDEMVLLRPMNLNDLNSLVTFSVKEPTLWKYSLMQPNTPQVMKVYIESAMKGRAQEKEYAFVVWDKRKNEYAGSTRFYDVQLDNKTTQLGYTWYGEAFQGTGLNAHCKYLLLSFAFEKMNLERVEFRADSDNEGSIRAMKNIGCTVEGILRNNLPKPTGGRRSSIVLSILKDDWFTSIKGQLVAKLK